MKLGVFLLSENFNNNTQQTILDDIEFGVLAEELGFDEVWFAEHHFNPFSVIPNPTLMMATLAAKTKKIRIGAAAFLTPFYNPTRLAEEISTLDNISNGRIDAGYAKGGFTLDLEYFNKDAKTLRAELFQDIKDIQTRIYEDARFEPKPIQKKIPSFIATFSTKETIEYAAKNSHGLMFSQGATLDECMQAQEYYKEIAGFYPQTILMRVFSVAPTKEEAHSIAIVSTEHFIKCMRAVKSKQDQPNFNKENYEELLAQRYEFFDASTFMQAAIIGGVDECIKQIKEIKNKIKNLHLVLKVASPDAEQAKEMLRTFSRDIKPKI